MRTDSKREFEEGEMTLYIIFYVLKCVCELAEAVNVKNIGHPPLAWLLLLLGWTHSKWNL